MSVSRVPVTTSDAEAQRLARQAAAGMTPTTRVRLRDAGIDPDVFPPRSLAEVSAELGVRVVPADAIVIERGDLPEVKANGPSLFVGSVYGGSTTGLTPERVEHTRREGLAGLALADFLADYLREHPPVDEAQVAAVEAILGDFAVADEHSGQRDDHQLATLLVRRGVRVEVAP